MVIRNIQIGERALFCAIIEKAVEDFVGMADDPIARESITFKSAEHFLFGNGPIDRAILRDPETGDNLSEMYGNGDESDIVGCTLKEVAQALNINGKPLDIAYLREGVRKKLEAKRRADGQRMELNRWKG